MKNGLTHQRSGAWLQPSQVSAFANVECIHEGVTFGSKIPRYQSRRPREREAFLRINEVV